MNLSTRSKTSSTIPFSTLTDLTVSKRVVEVGLNSPRLSYGSKFTLAPKSSKT